MELVQIYLVFEKKNYNYSTTGTNFLAFFQFFPQHFPF